MYDSPNPSNESQVFSPKTPNEPKCEGCRKRQKEIEDVKHAWKKHCKNEVEEQCQKLKEKHAKEKNEFDEKLKEVKSHLATSEDKSKWQGELIEQIKSENKQFKAEYEEIKSQMNSAIKLLRENKQYRNDSTDAIDEIQTIANSLFNKLGIQKLEVECQTNETRNESTQTIATQSDKLSKVISNRIQEIEDKKAKLDIAIQRTLEFQPTEVREPPVILDQFPDGNPDSGSATPPIDPDPAEIKIDQHNAEENSPPLDQNSDDDELAIRSVIDDGDVEARSHISDSDSDGIEFLGMGEDYIERAPTPFNEKQSGKNSTAARKKTDSIPIPITETEVNQNKNYETNMQGNIEYDRLTKKFQTFLLHSQIKIPSELVDSFFRNTPLQTIETKIDMDSVKEGLIRCAEDWIKKNNEGLGESTLNQ